jgi:TPR repeat protein
VTLRRLGTALGLLLALTSAAMAQRTDFEDLRPEGMRFPDNMTLEELPIGPVPENLLPHTSDEAVSISDQIFGVPVDEAFGAYQRGYFLTALALALPRAEKGDQHAQTLIGEIYSKGLGVAEDPKTAASWYQLGSEAGDPLATFELAMMYQEGRGVEKDRKLAASLFEKAAAAGNAMAKYNLGLLHIEGTYAQPNLVKAAELIGAAAEAGISEAQYDLGTMLSEGAGLAPDPVRATEQFRLAAEGGMVAAQIEYATALYLGKGVAKDRVAAAQWYQRAAEAGNPVAQNRYAKLLAAGEGVTLDLETSAMWRALARRQGLTDPQLDKLLVSIRPATLARAEERARFWPSQPPTAIADAAPAPEATATAQP